MHGHTRPEPQTIYYFNIMRYVQIDILKIIKLQPIKTKRTVRQLLQLIKNDTTVNSVTVTRMDFKTGMLARIVQILHIHFGIKFFLRKVISDLRSNTEQTAIMKQFVIFKYLPIGNTIAMTITDQ